MENRCRTRRLRWFWLIHTALSLSHRLLSFFFFQAEDGIRDYKVTGVQTCALPISTPDAGLGEMKQLARAIEEFLNGLPSEFDELVNCHDVRARQVEHYIQVS